MNFVKQFKIICDKNDLMLHAWKIELLGYKFESKEPSEFVRVMNMG